MPRNLSGLKRGGPGRPKGVPNKATLEFKEFWGQWLDSEAYQRNLQARILKGRAPHMETYIAQMVKGKPKETLSVEGVATAPLVIKLTDD